MQRFTVTLSRSVLGLVIAGFPIFARAQMNTPSGNSGTGMSSTASQGSSSLSTADRKFVREAAEGGMAEVELGRLAADKGSSDDVKKFGQRMVDDHSKANDQLKQIASSKSVDLPTEVSAKDKATQTRLSKLSGSEFDRAYMSDMVKDHKKDVAAFQHESSAGADPDIKKFASETLPTLQDHLKNAESIASGSTSAQSMSNPGTQTSKQ